MSRHHIFSVRLTLLALAAKKTKKKTNNVTFGLPFWTEVDDNQSHT